MVKTPVLVMNRANRIDVRRSVGRKQSRRDGDAHENHDREAKRPWVVKTFRRENDPQRFWLTMAIPVSGG